MYALVRNNSFAQAMLARGGQQFAEFDALHAGQPGYRGTVSIDIGNGRQLAVNLWESEESAIAALPVMGPAVKRLLEPMRGGPSELVGAGPVRQVT